MTIQQHLLNSLLLGSLAFSFGLKADDTQYCEKQFEVLKRDKSDGYFFEKEKLENLFCTNKFEGEYFKIVYSIEDEAISFDSENKELVKKAANVYHHLTVARKFWLQNVNSEFVKNLKQITIRLDITNAYSNLRHFKNAEMEKNYNNAWTIPEGETPSFSNERKKWTKEIWFSPMKKIESRKMVESDGSNPVHESLILVKDPIVEFNKNSLIYAGLAAVAAPSINPSALLDETIRRLGYIAVVYGLVEISKHLDTWFMDKYYYIDTAMVPDIIYHEYAHIAMSDTLKTIHSVPVIEGMADYFAARIVDRKKMYEQLENISTNTAKNRENKNMYHPYLEGAWNATSDFTLSLLWKGRLEFEAQNLKRTQAGLKKLANFDELIFESHYHLDENSEIATDLTRSLISACRSKCSNTRVGISTLHNVFEDKGLN